mmetsp:Transcript_19400/g.32220  ORF Transcript_19400/g.32220 Transcript_19400/m.32220 type:complete len:1151 (-) Transcript_19400:248-3700(-)
MIMNRKVIGGLLLALLLQSSASDNPPQFLLVNHETEECVEVLSSCMDDSPFITSFARCTPQQGWLMSSPEDCRAEFKMLAPESESDYVIYAQIRDTWHCNFYGSCQGMIYKNEDGSRFCSISLCDELPDGWNPALSLECHYSTTQGAGVSWVGPTTVGCDPCKSKHNCTDCVEIGCAWAWSEQTCSPTCDSLPCITDNRDGLCQDFEQQQTWNKECEEATFQDCMFLSTCRLVNAPARCVGNFCEGNCKEIWVDAPTINMCGTNSVGVGQPCSDHDDTTVCSNEEDAARPFFESLTCCCYGGSPSCTYLKGDSCPHPQVLPCEMYGVGPGKTCSTLGAPGKCRLDDGSTMYMTCCCDSDGNQSSDCIYVETGSDESGLVCAIPQCDLNPVHSTELSCATQGDIGRCFKKDGTIDEVLCCCVQGIPIDLYGLTCVYRDVSNESWCSIFEETGLWPCHESYANGGFCSPEGEEIPCADDENIVRRYRCCCHPVHGECIYEEVASKSDCTIGEIPDCESMDAGIGDSCLSSTHGTTTQCFDYSDLVELTCCCDPGEIECIYGKGSCVNEKACFMKTSELHEAIVLYLGDPSNPSSEVAEKYGWPINNWCVFNIENFSKIFQGYSAFNYDISDWDMSNARNLSLLFDGCTSFNQPIGSWDVSNVEDTELMFMDCVEFNQDLPWDVSSVKNMGGMFHSCSNFNTPIGNWNVSSVNNMGFMFSSAANFNQPIREWDVSSVIDMGNMFYYATSFDQDIGNWNVTSVESASYMFDQATSFNQDLSTWSVSFRWANRMFYGASSFSKSLCAWARHDLPENETKEMFVDTNCPHQQDGNSSLFRPMCLYCGHTCGTEGIGIGEHCLALSEEEVCMEDEEEVDLVCCHWRNDTYMKKGDWCICFSGENIVNEASKGEIKMKDLEIGDMVEVGHNQYDRVYGFGHYDPKGKGAYLQIYVQDLAKPLEITPDHLVFVQKDTVKTIPASKVKIGDKIVLSEGKTSLVAMIKTVERVGLFAPFTMSGKLLVSGFLASNYLSLGDSGTFDIGGISYSLHWLSHAFTFHRRVICGLSESLCGNETYGDDAMPRWVAGPRQFFTWLLGQRSVVQILVLAPFVVYSCLVTTVEYFAKSSLALTLLFIAGVNLAYDTNGVLTRLDSRHSS